MADRLRVRCPACRSVVPTVVVWIVDDRCPNCAEPLSTSGWRKSAGEGKRSSESQAGAVGVGSRRRSAATG